MATFQPLRAFALNGRAHLNGREGKAARVTGITTTEYARWVHKVRPTAHWRTWGLLGRGIVLKVEILRQYRLFGAKTGVLAAQAKLWQLGVV